MRKIYIDASYHCYATEAEGRRAVETEAFDNACDKAVECYIFVPKGEIYKDVVCVNGFIQCIDSIRSEAYQRQYEEILENEAAYERMRAELNAQNEALVNDMAQLVEEVYQSDLEMMTE